VGIEGMPVIRYSLSPQELKVWKGRIGDRVAECYIEEVLIPRLKKEEGWDGVLYTDGWFNMGASLYQKGEMFWKQELKILVCVGLFPTPDFLKRFEKLTNLLRNIPDGFLIKWRKTGKHITLKDALAKSGLESWESWRFGEFKYVRSEHSDKEQLPIVKGEVEVVEVKTGKGFLPPSQIESYTNIVKKGYRLRYFQVDIVSFERNQFEIREELVTIETKLRHLTLYNNS